MDPLWDWQIAAQCAGRIALAYVLALPIGWDREREGHSVGVRTFPLVAMASCGYVLLGRYFGGPDAGAYESRIIQGLLTGIGFIGAGAILKSQGDVHGTATAASIWNTGVIGAAVALGRWEIGIILSLLNLLTLRLLLPLKQRIERHQDEKQDAEREKR
jgi:putative Mg2+ transporter-C (MgtC) family protein